MKFIKPEMGLKELFTCPIKILLKSSSAKRETPLRYTLKITVEYKKVGLQDRSKDLLRREFRGSCVPSLDCFSGQFAALY